jgi:hypothetical protein
MKTPTSHAATSLLLALAVIGAAAGAVMAAKEEAAEQAPADPIEVVKGATYRMAKTKMADRVVRLDDAAGDPVFADGSTATGAPQWADIEAVYLASTRMPAKLMTKMAKDFPPGVSGAFYGNEARWSVGDDAIFVAVEMADKLPPDAAGQQVEIGIGGDAATPVQVGAQLDTRAGVERFSLSGVFSNGAFATGTTDISGRAPGAAIDYYNTESGDFGYYDARRATWYLLIPAAADSDSIVVSVRSSTEVGEVLDRLELPGGGHFVSLADPTGGWSKQAGLPPLACRSLETFSAETAAGLSDPAGTRIRYTTGVATSGNAGAASEPGTDDTGAQLALLGPATDVMGSVPVALTAVGSGDEPSTVNGELAVSAQQDAVTLTFEAPAGQWSFALAEGSELLTPAGEAIIDHSSLTGAAGVATGLGLDGFVTGNAACAGEPSEPAAGSGDPTADGSPDPTTAPAEAETEG